MSKHEDFQDEIGDNHIATNAQNPIRKDAFDLSDQEKIESIKKDVENIMTTLGMDMTDDSLRGTPNRVAKMFVKETFGGLIQNTNRGLRRSKTTTNMVRCWSKKT